MAKLFLTDDHPRIILIDTEKVYSPDLEVELGNHTVKELMDLQRQYMEAQKILCKWVDNGGTDANL